MRDIPKFPKSVPKIRLYTSISVLKILGAAVILLPIYGCKQKVVVENSNRLALGADAKSRATQAVSLIRPIDLSGMTQERICEVRSQVLSKNDSLIQGSYACWPPVFDSIDSDKPWTRIMGLQFDGQANLCGQGESYESSFILNPLMLVTPHFTGMSLFRRDLNWKTGSVTEASIKDPNFPLYLKPSSFEWRAGESSARLVYNLSDYLEKVNLYLEKPVGIGDSQFHLIAYNALDFNLKYLFLPQQEAQNIKFGSPMSEPLMITDRILPRNMIKNGVVCNGASFPASDLRRIEVTALPARLVVYLWRSQPSDPASKPAMTFTIEFN